MRQVLRGYQVAADARLREALARVRSVCLCMPTGAGKTTTASHFIEQETLSNRRTLFLAHRRELIYQCSERLDEHDIPHGIIMAGTGRLLPDLPVQVASVQTLARRQSSYGRFDNVFIDEAHRATAITYLQRLDYYPDAKIIGLTATPARLGGRGLGDLFNELVIGAPPSELLRDGYLVPTAGFCYDNPDVSTVDVKTTGDYDAHGLELAVSTRKILGNIVERWKEHAYGMRTILFACTLNHSRQLAQEFENSGIHSAHVDGETPMVARAAILDRLKHGDLRVVCNVGVLTEGFDAPTVECIILARPTKSLTLHIQMAGRGCRPACLRCGAFAHPGWTACKTCGSPNIKRAMRLHDHAGSCLQHGLPLTDREWTLTKTKAKAQNESGLKTCPNCLAILPNMCSTCSVCGYTFTVQSRKGPETIDGDIIDLSDVEARRKRDRENNHRLQEYKNLARVAVERGFKPGWVDYTFKAKFGSWPDRSWRRMVGL